MRPSWFAHRPASRSGRVDLSVLAAKNAAFMAESRCEFDGKSAAICCGRENYTRLLQNANTFFDDASSRRAATYGAEAVAVESRMRHSIQDTSRIAAFVMTNHGRSRRRTEMHEGSRSCHRADIAMSALDARSMRARCALNARLRTVRRTAALTAAANDYGISTLSTT